MLDWTLDLIFSKDLVQFQTFRTRGLSHPETFPADPTSKAVNETSSSGKPRVPEYQHAGS